MVAGAHIAVGDFALLPTAYIALTSNLNPSFFAFLVAVDIVNLAAVRQLKR